MMVVSDLVILGAVLTEALQDLDPPIRDQQDLQVDSEDK